MPNYFGPIPGGGPLQSASFTLTAAQIKALHTSGPLVVVPGIPGKVLVPVTITYNYGFGTVGYAVTAGNGLFVGWDGYAFANGQAASVLVNGWLDQLVNQMHISSFADGPIDAASSNFIGKGLNFGMGAGATNPTLGDGTITVNITYVAVPAS